MRLSSTNTNGNVSINQNGVITVNNSTYGVETITMSFKTTTSPNAYWLQGELRRYPGRELTATIIINPSPAAPTMSYPYNMDDYLHYAYDAINGGTVHRFTMSNCGSSSSDSDYEWTYDGDAMFCDINGIPNSEGDAEGKVIYMSGGGGDAGYLKCRYRANSNAPWSAWKSQYIEFVGGMELLFAPNPVFYGVTEVTVQSTNALAPIDYNEGYELEVIDVMTSITKVKKTKVQKKNYKLKTHGWKAGHYIVIAKYKGEIVSKKLQVE